MIRWFYGYCVQSFGSDSFASMQMFALSHMNACKKCYYLAYGWLENGRPDLDFLFLICWLEWRYSFGVVLASSEGMWNVGWGSAVCTGQTKLTDEPLIKESSHPALLKNTCAQLRVPNMQVRQGQILNSIYIFFYFSCSVICLHLIVSITANNSCQLCQNDWQLVRWSAS